VYFKYSFKSPSPTLECGKQLNTYCKHTQTSKYGDCLACTNRYKSPECTSEQVVDFCHGIPV